MFTSLIKVFTTIMATAFPVKDYTIWVDFINFCNQLFKSVIWVFFIKSIIDIIDGIAGALIDKDFGSLFGFLLYTGK